MDRRTFLKSAAVAGGVGAFAQVASPLASAGPVDAARYRTAVPEIFAPIPDVPEFVPAIVIGSGFGGAVAACRLAQAGVGVAVLERGSRWPIDPQRGIFANDAFPDGRGFWHRTSFTGVTGIPQYFDDFGGVLDITDFSGIQVWRGAAVGGGSVVYTGVMIEPEQRFFDKVFAGTGVGYGEMHSSFYPRVRSNLLVSPMPDDIYNAQQFTHSRIWDGQSSKAGYQPQLIDGVWNWNTVRSEIRGTSSPSATIGCSNLGNSNGAKYDLTQNYLRWAEDTGRASIHPGHRVLSIGRESGGRYRIEVEKIDPTGAVLSTRTVTCNKLVLAAGSVGTTELLVAARDTGTLPDLNEHVGRGWGTNGDAALVRGVTPGGVTQGAPSRSRILDESGMPVTLENWYVPGPIVDAGFTASLGMALDDARGDFFYNRDTGRVDLRWPGQPAADEAMRAVNRKIADMSGVATGFAQLAKDVNSSFTAHPLGGAVLGKAADTHGRLIGYDGLYVMDGAAIPGSTGTVNPSLTITALAGRNMDAIIAAGK